MKKINIYAKRQSRSDDTARLTLSQISYKYLIVKKFRFKVNQEKNKMIKKIK